MDKIKVIFLDFDGVLNNDGFLDFCVENGVAPDDRIDGKAVKRLNQIVADTGAKIVVSSALRIPFVMSNDLDALIDLMRGHGVKGDIIGMTPDLWNMKRDRCRGDEIQQWMDDSPFIIDKFVILDDNSDMGHLRFWLIQTDFKHGLQMSHVLDAIDVLNVGANPKTVSL